MKALRNLKIREKTSKREPRIQKKKSKEVLQKTKEHTRSERHDISNTASSYTKERKKIVREKKSTKKASEGSPMEIERYTARGDLDEIFIEEVAKRVREIQAFYLTDQAAAMMKGIIRSPFTT